MKLIPFPELRQTFAYDCGASALQSVLVFAGIDLREDTIMRLAKTDGDGTTVGGMLRVLNFFGVAAAAQEILLPTDLRRAIDGGQPTIIALQAYRDDPDVPYAACWDDGHYVVAIGYDEAGIIFEDPSAFTRTRLSDAELCERWHDIDEYRRIYHWGCTVLADGKFVPGAIEHME